MLASDAHWTFFRRLLASGVAVVLLGGGYLGLALETYNR